MVNDTDAQLLNLKNNILSYKRLYSSEALMHVCKLIHSTKSTSRFLSFRAQSLNVLICIF